MIRRPPRSTPLYSSAASDVYKRQPIYLSNNNLDGFHKLVYAPHWTTAPKAAQAQLITIAGARNRLMKSRETIRVGAGAGTSDDRMVPALELAERGDIDYLVFE